MTPFVGPTGKVTPFSHTAETVSEAGVERTSVMDHAKVMGAPEAILKNATDVWGGEVTVMEPAGAVWGMEIDELFEADVAPDDAAEPVFVPEAADPVAEPVVEPVTDEPVAEPVAEVPVLDATDDMAADYDDDGESKVETTTTGRLKAAREATADLELSETPA